MTLERSTVTALVALGANLGSREKSLAQAVELLRQTPGMQVVAQSRWYATQPIGGPTDQPEFLNGVVRLESELPMAVLHARLKEIERTIGRNDHERWAARKIDLDLLLFGEARISGAALTVPHPRMAVRRFVLEPAAEIAGDVVHSEILWTVGQLLEHLQVSRPYLALAGGIADDRRWLLDELGVARACLEWNESREGHPEQGGSWWATDAWVDEELMRNPPKLRKPVEAPKLPEIPPKLVVVVHNSQRRTSDDDRNWQTRVEQQARRPWRGPTLTVDLALGQAAIAEVVAALQSMR